MPYRDELEALEHREAHLVDELARLDRDLARARSLEDDRQAVADQLGEVRQLLDGRSVLAGVRAASPCSATWELMEGAERSRRCQVCGKRVVNVSGLSRSQALGLLVELAHREPGPTGRLAALRRREDGTLIEGDCPLGSRLRQRGRTVVTGGTLAVVGAGLLVSAAATSDLQPDDLRHDPNAVDGAAAVHGSDSVHQVDAVHQAGVMPRLERLHDLERRAIEVELDDQIDVALDERGPRD